LYQHGRGVAKDDTQAAVWFRKAAEQGNEEAQRSLDLISGAVGTSQELATKAPDRTAGDGKTISVKIIQRQNSETGYSYIVPGHSTATSDTSLNCYAGSTNVNCSGRTTTNEYDTAPRAISYSVSGATFSLLLPDGRIAVVNCESKFKEKMDYINRRSCRTPLVNDIQAEFKGKNAKLVWSVSLDGKKTESETYKILAVVDK
jgi:hypothetical protein